MSTPTLEIDLVNVSLSEVWVHQQDDPNPGGYTFVLKVPYEYLGKWKETLRASAPQADLAKVALKMVKWEISNWPRQQLGNEIARFVLNKVTKIEFGESAMILSGICSPHQHTGA